MHNQNHISKSLPNHGVTLKSILIGLFLIPINCYWIMYTEMVWWAQFPTTMSLFFNVIFCLFIIILLNLLIRRYLPNQALTHSEFLVIYAMLCMSSAIASHDHAQVLIPMIGHVFWFDTPENEWRELIWTYMPQWVTISNKEILTGYYRGDSTFYQWEIVRAWLRPALWWTSFIFVLLFVMLCINVILRKQWIEREKLAYPIIQLPLEMTRDSGAQFFKNRLFWIAFGIVTVIDIVNGFSQFFPAIPILGVRNRNISHLFTEKPWNAIGWTPFSIYPFVVGLGFFMPLDLSFSCWFFYLFRKSQRILGAVLGIRSLPGFPYDRQQSLGAYLGLSIFAVWASRKYFKEVLKQAVKIRSRRTTDGIDDSDEPMRYRTAFLGIVAGMAYLIFFCYKMGMSVWVGIAVFVIYYMLSMGITRMRVESGAPAHDLHFMGPDYSIPAAVGTRKLGGNNLTALSFMFFFNRAHRSHPMPHQLEAFKLAERTGIRNRGLVLAMLLAVVVGSLSSFWAYLHDVYIHGSGGSFAWHPFNRLQGWLTIPQPSDIPAVSFIGVGIAFTFFLMFMRIKFFWWPFHAVGYAVSGADDWCMNWLWPSLVISTIAKYLLLKHGGLKTHRQAAPFFLGLVLGEFVIGSLWSIYGLSAGVRTFMFKDW